jgi:glycosyltransferase involved in cell wall biosynthesis
MEAAVVTNADHVTTTTIALQRAMQQRYPESAHKFVYVPNGVDARMLASEPASPFPVFTITYAGALYYRRTPEPLFAAVQQLLQSGRVSEAEIRLKFVGDCDMVDGVPTRAVAERFGLGGVVELEPRLPHREAMELMRRSHLLLVLAPHAHRLVLPAKIFDYIGCGRRVLAIAEPGPTSDLIADTECGACFSASQTGAIAAYIESALRGHAPAVDHRVLLERYGMARLAGRLADLMTGSADPMPATLAERA